CRYRREPVSLRRCCFGIPGNQRGPSLCYTLPRSPDTPCPYQNQSCRYTHEPRGLGFVPREGDPETEAARGRLATAQLHRRCRRRVPAAAVACHILALRS